MKAETSNLQMETNEKLEGSGITDTDTMGRQDSIYNYL